MNQIVTKAREHAGQWLGQGNAATFIPELTRQDPNQLGIAITNCRGETFCVGECTTLFTIQSISKLMTR